MPGVGKLFARRAALEKNFEAEGRSYWKSKVKKIITTTDVLFSTQNQVKSQKEFNYVREVLIIKW